MHTARLVTSCFAIAASVIACHAPVTTGPAPTAPPSYATLPEVPPAPPPTRSGQARVNDITMHYATYGTGKPILLLHGGLGHSGYWSFQIPDLAKTHEVIVVDSRGHGRSTRSSAPYSYALMASDVVTFLDYLHVPKAAIVGWSDGGIIGLHIAMHHPARVERLFAFGANFNVTGLKPDFDKDPTFAAYIERAGRDYPRVSPTPTKFGEFVEALTTMWNSQPSYRADDLRRITAPTTIADGAHEELITREHTEELARLIPGARLLILPDVSHFAPWQNPGQFNRAVLEFVDAK